MKIAGGLPMGIRLSSRMVGCEAVCAGGGRSHEGGGDVGGEWNVCPSRQVASHVTNNMEPCVCAQLLLYRAKPIKSLARYSGSV